MNILALFFIRNNLWWDIYMPHQAFTQDAPEPPHPSPGSPSLSFYKRLQPPPQDRCNVPSLVLFPYVPVSSTGKYSLYHFFWQIILSVA